MKFFLYIFTIGLLLFVVFNPKGIMRLQKERATVQALSKQDKEKDTILKLRTDELNELQNYIQSILDQPGLTNVPSPIYSENVERTLVLKGIIHKKNQIMRWYKKRPYLK